MTLSLDTQTVETDTDHVIDAVLVATREERAGMGRCDKCSCTGYTDGNYGNSYCTCSHSYGDHW